MLLATALLGMMLAGGKATQPKQAQASEVPAGASLPIANLSTSTSTQLGSASVTGNPRALVMQARPDRLEIDLINLGLAASQPASATGASTPTVARLSGSVIITPPDAHGFASFALRGHGAFSEPIAGVSGAAEPSYRLNVTAFDQVTNARIYSATLTGTTHGQKVDGTASDEVVAVPGHGLKLTFLAQVNAGEGPAPGARSVILDSVSVVAEMQ